MEKDWADRQAALLVTAMDDQPWGPVLARGVAGADEEQVGSLLLCSVVGALSRYGPMSSERIAAVHGISTLLVEQALARLMLNNEVLFDKAQEAWVLPTW